MSQTLSLKKQPQNEALKPCIRDFWLVWRVTSGRFRHKHRSKSSAIKEANRLSALHPKETFVVLHSEGYSGLGIDRDGTDLL